MKKIAVLVLNNLVNDSRVLKEIESLSKYFLVDVYCFQSENQPKYESIDGANVIRLINYNKSYSGPFRKIYQGYIYCSFFLKVLFKLKDYDVVHCNDLDTLPHGIFSKFLYRKLKVVYDAHEYETETLWMQNRLKKKFSKLLEGSLIKYCDLTITVSSSIASEYVKNYNIPMPTVILNTPKFSSINKDRDLFRLKYNLSSSDKIFLYQGGLTNGRGIEMMVDAFLNIGISNIYLVIMGNGPIKGSIDLKVMNSNNIFFHDFVSSKNLLDYTSSADYGILFYENTCLNHFYCSPNKLFEYIMAEIPVVVSNLFELNRIVNSYQLGVVSSEISTSGIQECIEDISTRDKSDYKNYLESAKSDFNWENQESLLIKEYKNILNEKV